MKANTGNGKLPGTKERKSGHCELQRTAWKGTVDIQFGQTRGTNIKKKKKEKRGRKRKREGRKREGKTNGGRGEGERTRRVLANQERAPILPKTTDFGTDIDSRTDVTVIRRAFPDVRRAERAGRGRGEGREGRESIAARNNLQPFNLDVSPALFMKE